MTGVRKKPTLTYLQSFLLTMLVGGLLIMAADGIGKLTNGSIGELAFVAFFLITIFGGGWLLDRSRGY